MQERRLSKETLDSVSSELDDMLDMDISPILNTNSYFKKQPLKFSFTKMMNHYHDQIPHYDFMLIFLLPSFIKLSYCIKGR